MSKDVYPIKRDRNGLVFLFWSNNQEGTNPILKVVSYAKMIKYRKTYYNLAFSDYDWINDDTYDFVATNNRDMRKVLRTVASTLELFFRKHPNEKVHIEGSDRVRHTYYHKLTRGYFDMISQKFTVAGCLKGKILPFDDNLEYEFIIVSI